MKYTFPKKMKLKSQTLISKLFEEGKSIKVFPLRVLYIKTNKDYHQIGVCTPKKNFKKAVDRNRIKRLMREAYRLQQHLFKSKQKYAVMFFYMQKKEYLYKDFSEKMKHLLNEFNNCVNDQIYDE